MLFASFIIPAALEVLAQLGAIGDDILDPPSLAPPPVAVLIDALEAYESSIECLSWHQTEYHPPAICRNRPEWMLLQVSDRYADVQWQSYLQIQHLILEPPNFDTSYLRMSYVQSGCQRVTFDRQQDTGMLTQPDHFFAGGCNVWRMMGRCADYERPMFSQPLAAYLRWASTLTWLDATEEEPWPGVRAEGAISRGWLDAEVRLDPEHGFAPRIIRMVRPSDGLLVEAYIIVRYTMADGVWIPSLVIQGANYVDVVQEMAGNADASLPPTHSGDFGLARSLAGLPEEMQSADVAFWIDRLVRVDILDRKAGLVTGPLVWLNPDEPLYAPAIATATDIRVNDPLHWDEALGSIPADGKMFNGLTGEWMTGAKAKQMFLDLKAP